MAKPFDRLPIRPARKRSSHELPPDDLSDFERPLLRRRTTLLDYVEAPRAFDPFVLTFTDEPSELVPDCETSLLEIDQLEKLHRRDVEKPLTGISRVSTGFSQPSRSSTLDPVDGISQTLCGLTIGVGDIYDGYTFDSRSERRSRSGIAEFAPTPGTTPGSSRYASQRSAPSRETSSSSIPAASQRLNRRGSTTAPILEDRVAEGRVTKQQTGIIPAKDKKPAPSKNAGPGCLSLGCPMVKGERERYEGVIGPCTDLKGITPTPKALMEHLKKQHSKDFRCVICWKWHKSRADLDGHTVEKLGFVRCEYCCKYFKTKKDLTDHQGSNCSLDEMSRPQLFSPAQEKAFKDMKNKSATHGNLVKKFRWIFGSLFPDHAEKDTIWPYYDFAIIKHKLPESCKIQDKELEQVAGGLRRDPMAPTSPSDPSEQHISPRPPTTADSSPVAARNPSVDFNIAMQGMMRSQHTFIPPQQTGDYFSPPGISAGVPAPPHPRMLGHNQRFSSFGSSLPPMTDDTQSIEPPPMAPTPQDRMMGIQHMSPVPQQAHNPGTDAQQFIPKYDINDFNNQASFSFPPTTAFNMSTSAINSPVTTTDFRVPAPPAIMNPSFAQEYDDSGQNLWDLGGYQKFTDGSSFEPTYPSTQDTMYWPDSTPPVPDTGGNDLMSHYHNLGEGSASHPAYSQGQ